MSLINSPESSSVDSSSSFQNSSSNRISSSSFKLWPTSHNQIVRVALQYIATDLINSLMTINLNKFAAARNHIVIPHGMFRCSLYNFNARLKENSTYIDLLEMASQDTLKDAKIGIIIDDLCDLVKSLFIGLNEKQLEDIVGEITDSEKLLLFNKTMKAEFKRNATAMHSLMDSLKEFNMVEQKAMADMDLEVCAMQNMCIDAEYVFDPMEKRYKIDYLMRVSDQYGYEMHQIEKEHIETLKKIEFNHKREHIVANGIRISMESEIDTIKSKIEKMTKAYDLEYDYWDNKIKFNKLMVQMIQMQHQDYKERMQYYASAVVELREWEEMRNLKMSGEGKDEAIVKQKPKEKLEKKISRKVRFQM